MPRSRPSRTAHILSDRDLAEKSPVSKKGNTTKRYTSVCLHSNLFVVSPSALWCFGACMQAQPTRIPEFRLLYFWLVLLQRRVCMASKTQLQQQQNTKKFTPKEARTKRRRTRERIASETHCFCPLAREGLLFCQTFSLVCLDPSKNLHAPKKPTYG